MRLTSVCSIAVCLGTLAASRADAQNLSREDLQSFVNATRAAQERQAREQERADVINLSGPDDPSRQLANVMLARSATALKRRGVSKKLREAATKFQIPPLAPPLRMGDVGPLPGHHVNVLQVHGPNEFRGQILGEISASQTECIVRGIPTAGMSDRSGQSISKCFRVTGSARYLTVGGTSRTLCLLEPFDTSRAEQLFAEAVAPKKKIRAVITPAKEPTDPEAAARKKFRGVLKNARNLAKAKIYAAARKDFERIIAGAPGTAIAKEARQELDQLPAGP